MRRSRPPVPRLPFALLGALLARADRDEVLTDVAEEYAARAAGEGRAAARRWLWRQALGSAPALLGRSWWREWSGFEPRVDTYDPGGPVLRSWIADAHYAARRLRARPAYALLSVLTLALGVGGTAAAYGIARGLLFEPLPYAHEQEVGVFWKKTDWTEEEFLYLRGRVPGFGQVALYRLGDATLRRGDAPARLLPGITASAELFDVLGAPPLLGRGFRAGDDAEGAEPVAVLSYGLWRELGGDPSIVGTPLTLDGTPRTVVGVMPRGFWFPDPTVRIWTHRVCQRRRPHAGPGRRAVRRARGALGARRASRPTGPCSPRRRGSPWPPGCSWPSCPRCRSGAATCAARWAARAPAWSKGGADGWRAGWSWRRSRSPCWSPPVPPCSRAALRTFTRWTLAYVRRE
jgi:hypothetical protein